MANRKDELQSQQTQNATPNGKGNTKNGRGRNVNRGGRSSRNNSVDSTNATSSASSIFNPNDLYPLGCPGAITDVIPTNFGSTLDHEFEFNGVSGTFFTSDGKTTVNNFNPKLYTPGIATFGLMPTIGPVTKSSSGKASLLYNAMNECAASLYADIARSNAGARRYDPSDVMMYIYAVGSAYSLLSHLTRIYGCLNLYNFYNDYVPTTLLKALGVAFPDDVKLRMSQFRDLINTFARRLANFPIPSKFPVINRMAHMFDDIYVDANSPRAQIYAFIPHGFYVYGGVTGAHVLTIHKWENVLSHISSGNTLEHFAGLVSTLLDPLMLSQDLGDIKRDLLKTFENSDLVTPSELLADYMCMPRYDESMLNALVNATPVGPYVGSIQVDEFGSIYQSLDKGAGPIYNKAFLNLDHINSGDIRPEHVLIATSFVVTTEDDVVSFSPEVITSATIYDGDQAIVCNFDGRFNSTTGERWSVPGQNLLTRLPFSYFPRTLFIDVNDNQSAWVYDELNSYRVFTHDEITRINRMKMEGLFGLPYHFG